MSNSESVPLRFRSDHVMNMIAWGVTRGAFLGLLYGPISILALVAIYQVAQWLRLVEDGSTISWTMVFSLLVASLVVGSVLGAITGLLSSAAMALVLGALFRFGLGSPLRLGQWRFKLSAVCGTISGLITLAVTVSSRLPDTLTGRAPIVGWALWVVVPTLLTFIAAWWLANNTIGSLEDRANAGSVG